jgi:hypothetical protein
VGKTEQVRQVKENSAPTEKNTDQDNSLFMLISTVVRSRDIVVCIATGYGLDDQGVGVRVAVGLRMFSSPLRPHRLWGPPSLISNGYKGLFLRE